MTVPDEAVEAAREALRSKVNQIRYGEEWDDWRARQARAVIEAAAPFIAAQAWDAGWNAGMRFESPKNPYRSGQ